MLEPQKLTPEEIEDVVSSLPMCMAATKKVADKMYQQIQNKLRVQLADIKLVKKPEAFEKLKRMIIMQHNNSRVAAGEPVGFRAAESIGQPTTQMALNAFHSAGSSASMNTGIDAVKELYNVSEKRKQENSYIHFKNNDLTFEDVIHMRRKIVGVNVEELLKSPPKYQRYTAEEEPYWYNTYLNITKTKLPFDRQDVFEEEDFRNHYMRLTFNLNKLYEYNLTPYIIAEKLSMAEIVCVPSPTCIGIIDIYTDSNIIINSLNKMNKDKSKDAVKIFTPQNAPILYLQIFTESSLRDSVINGVKGITQIFPVETPVISTIKREEKITDDKWKLWIDDILLILKGVPLEKLVKFIGSCKMTIIPKENMKDPYILVENFVKAVEHFKMFNASSPMDLMKKVLAEEVKIMKSKMKSSGQQYPIREITEIIRNGYYVHANSNGTNLIKLLSNQEVDFSRTYCSNPHDVLSALGIEATRNFMIRSYIDIIEANREYSNPRHIMLTVDFQTSKGVLLPISSRGAARQNIGPLATASFEQPMDAFIDAAAFGKDEKILSTSTSIFVGKRMILGTGAFKARLDVEALERAEKLRNEMKTQNPERFENLDDTSQLAFMNSLENDDNLLIYYDEQEMENGHHTGLYGAATVDQRPLQAEIKFKNDVPNVIIARSQTLPNFILSIVNQKSAIINSETLKPLIPVSPVVKPLKSVVQTSISKPGLPALPKLNFQQMISSSPQVRVNDVSVNDILNF